MKEQIINQNWLFHLEDALYKQTGIHADKDCYSEYGLEKTGLATGFAARKFMYSDWRKINLPHDYAVELPFDLNAYAPQGYKPVGNRATKDKAGKMRMETPNYPIAWYRKSFFLDDNGDYVDSHDEVYGSTNSEPPANKRYFLVFEGVYRAYTIWVNGVYMDHIVSGYSETVIDVTDQVIFGETNTIAVRVDASHYEGWWYDGAGIYRNVKLVTTGNCYCLPQDFYVHTSADGAVNVFCEIKNATETEQNCNAEIRISKDGICVAKQSCDCILSLENNKIEMNLQVDNPVLWDIENPALYEIELILNDETEQKQNIGFKSVKFDNEKGFFLNGKSMKLNGVCLHQDLFGVGVAIPDDFSDYKLKVMKEMGVNALRCVHNPASRQVMDACDRLGILVMDETRMFGSSPEALRQLESLVKRDRNHPCLLMWSIGNEEPIQNTVFARRMTETAIRAIKKLTINPIITYGANNGNKYEGVNELLDVRGFNYIRINTVEHPDDYHTSHPHQASYSSEENSFLVTRGEYKIDKERRVVDGYGETTMVWGSTAPGFLKFCDERDWYCGGFAWTGFDYRGEPSPYADENVIGNFGIVDLCGFPKDIYYYYKAWWTNEPVLHLLPHWHFEQGEKVRVMAHTNCEKVSLFVNGKLVSEQTVQKFDSPEWDVEFEAGEIKAVGITDGKEYVSIRRTTDMAGICAETEKHGDYSFVTVKAIDADGEVYPIGQNEISFDTDNTEILGIGNGDPTSYQREVYYIEETTLEIADFVCEKTEKATGLKDTLYYEPANSRFNDKCRWVWQVCAPPPRDVHTFKSEFTLAEQADFIQFETTNETEVFLDGEKIGETESGGLRPYRFERSVPAGKHTLTAVLKTVPGRVFHIKNIRAGKFLKPQVKHKLFNGLLKAIVKGSGTIYMKSDNGFETKITV